MTGFARIRKSAPNAELLVTIKTVNHRALDVHCHLPSELDEFEAALRAAVKRQCARGHFQVHAALTRTDAGAEATINSGMLEAYLTAFRQAAGRHALPGEPDLNSALSIPGMFREGPADEQREELGRLLLEAAEEALEALNRFREREGGQIAAEMLDRTAAVRARAASMEEIRSRAVPAFQARLAERLGELLQGANLEPQRLAQEAAILADRSDVGEELSRLKIHAEQVAEILGKGGEVGKKLEFLLQEMNREANTILSKATGVGEQGLEITDLALAAKADIEKIREQSLNLE